MKHSVEYDDETCDTSYVGIALSPASIKSVLAAGEESNYDVTLCDRILDGNCYHEFNTVMSHRNYHFYENRVWQTSSTHLLLQGMVHLGLM